MIGNNNNKRKNLANLFRQARTRTIIIVTGVLVLLAILVGIFRLTAPTPGPQSEVNLHEVPGNIKAVPGGFDHPESPEYAKLQEQQNLQQAQLAAQSGTSAVPTIIRSGQIGGAQNLTANGTACCQPCPCPQAGGGTGAGGVCGPLPLGQPSTLRPGSIVYDPQGRVLGTIGPDGKVRDANGNIIGTVGPDGLVRDVGGNIIGSAGVAAAGMPIYDNKGNFFGTVGPDGKVRNSTGDVIGIVCPDGMVRDQNGTIKGKAGSALAGSPVYDSQGRLIGTVGPDGKVRDANGNIIGSVDPDGTVRDASGNIIGRVGSAVAGASPVYDAQGRLIGTLGPDGKVRDANGRIIGTAGADGVVRDANGKVIGQVQGKEAGGIVAGTPVYDAQGRLIGTVGPDGKVRDANGRVIGTVGPDGIVRDADGNIIGRAQGAGAPTTGTPVYDAQGHLIGVEGPDGRVYGPDSKIKGVVGNNGIARDGTTGEVVGKAGSIVPGTPVYDAQGRLIGTVGPDGIVRDANGNVVGKVGPDGLVRDADGNIVGKVGPTLAGTPIYDAQGRLIGIAGPDGKVRDADGRVIGTLGPDGLVHDAAGNVIGSSTPTGLAAQQGRAAGGLPSAVIPGALPGSQEAQLQAVAARQAEMFSKQQADQLRNQIQGAMAGQANQLIAAWVSPLQQFVQGTPPAIKVAAPGATVVTTTTGGVGGTSVTTIGATPEPAVKAGTVMYGVLVTAINSDEPGPILGNIVSGKFKGGRLLGTLTNQGQTVMVTFNSLTMPNIPASIPINAVAIDPCTARTAFSTYTNNHYLLRYGTLFASSFIQGYGQAFQTSGQTVISTGLATATTTPDLSPAGKFLVALGNVGTRYSAVLGNVFNTPPTVYVSSGTAMGILFLSDVAPIQGITS